MTRESPHILGIDDVPFVRGYRGDVRLVGTVFCGMRLEGVLTGRVRKDGANATDRIARMAGASRFFDHLQGIMLQGITVAGFNVVDIRALSERLSLPVVAVVRQPPDMAAVHAALLGKVPGGERKWRLVEKAGPVEPAGRVYIQKAGLPLSEARELVERYAVHSDLPEPLRTAHLIAGGITTGESRHRP